MTKANWKSATWLVCSVLMACADDSSAIDAADGGEKADTKDAGKQPYVSTGDAPKELWSPGAAEPCDIKSGYPGDELCIKPPPPDKGFQIHYGPSNYDDPKEVAKYILMPNEEVTDCVFGTTPNETETFHNEYHGRMRPGSHHLLVYTEDNMAAVPASTMPVACSQGLSTRNIFGAQTPTIDLVSGSDGAPENQGLAQRLAPKQRSVAQLHFINTTNKPILREAWCNVMYVDKSKVKAQADPIFFLGGIAAQIQPGTTHISKGKAVAAEPLRLVQATGHFHAHTIRFSAWKTIDGVRSPLFDDYNWHEPSMFMFSSKTTNPTANADTKTVGAFSGVVSLEKGDSIDWECEVVNDGNTTLGFGNEVYKAEMCNMFGAYTPGSGKPWSATNL